MVFYEALLSESFSRDLRLSLERHAPIGLFNYNECVEQETKMKYWGRKDIVCDGCMRVIA